MPYTTPTASSQRHINHQPPFRVTLPDKKKRDPARLSSTRGLMIRSVHMSARALSRPSLFLIKIQPKHGQQIEKTRIDATADDPTNQFKPNINHSLSLSQTNLNRSSTENISEKKMALRIYSIRFDSTPPDERGKEARKKTDRFRIKTAWTMVRSRQR